jgi:hypothetical protein
VNSSRSAWRWRREVTRLTTGFVQWFKVARDDSGGFRFVPASWSDITLSAQAIVPEAGGTTAAAAEETAEQPVGAAPGAKPI